MTPAARPRPAPWISQEVEWKIWCLTLAEALGYIYGPLSGVEHPSQDFARWLAGYEDFLVQADPDNLTASPDVLDALT